MKDSALYIKLVEWSDEDQCFIGQCPGIIGPCCHGDDEAQVYAELCQIVEETPTSTYYGEKCGGETFGQCLPRNYAIKRHGCL